MILGSQKELNFKKECPFMPKINSNWPNGVIPKHIVDQKFEKLYKAKQKAVEFEDFDEAKRIKVAIGSLKSVSQSLIKLEERKKIAIKNDDFDAAKLIKCEIDRLRNAVAGVNLNEMNRKIMQNNNFQH